jgi:hypothetical protein
MWNLALWDGFCFDATTRKNLRATTAQRTWAAFLAYLDFRSLGFRFRSAAFC